MKNWFPFSLLMVLLALTADAQVIFFDDFEGNLSKWDVSNHAKIDITDTGDEEHGKALRLNPGGSGTYALMRGSDDWTNMRVEGDVMFPVNYHAYLGFIYNFIITGDRSDYGCLYIKGNGSYIRVNPHRDDNVSRVLYEEFKTRLTGNDTIEIGKWQRFKAEVEGSICHLYVGDMTTPKVTFLYHEFAKGKIGFEPRVRGAEVWIDNIRVTPIADLSYNGGVRPKGPEYHFNDYVTNWRAIGPFRKAVEDIEKEGYDGGKTYNVAGQSYTWKPFSTDARGCVIGGKIIEWASDKKYAYFHTTISSSERKKATLKISSSNKMKVWLNGKYIWEVPDNGYAWYDFHKNKDHAGSALEIRLKKGKNELIVLEEGEGYRSYSGDGFFMVLKQ